MARKRKDKENVVTRKDIAREMAEDFDMTVSQAELLIQYTFSKIAEHVLADEEVMIMQFGQFYLQDYKNRRIKHPVTGEEMVTSSTKSMKMIPAKNLKRFKQDEFEPKKLK